MIARELLKKLMSQAGDNASALAVKADVPQATLYRFLSAPSAEPQRRMLEPIAKYYGIPAEAFFSEVVRTDVAAALMIEQGVKRHPD